MGGDPRDSNLLPVGEPSPSLLPCDSNLELLLSVRSLVGETVTRLS